MPFHPSLHVERAEQHYTLSARVRPLLFWIRRDNVGAGRITWTNSADGGQGLELLIGSDPDRVPMRINRWGYLAEFRRPGTADVLGVMTESDEATVEEAKQKLERRTGAGHPYRAIRTRIQAGESATTLLRLEFPNTVTFRELDRIRQRVEAGEGRLQLADVPSNAEPGFLTAVARLVRESVEGYRSHETLAQGVSRLYVYANQVYEVTVQKTKAHPGFLIGGAPHNLLESEFQVRNTATGRTTRFRISYGTDGPLAETPVRVVFRPNWWFEAELNLQAQKGK